MKRAEPHSQYTLRGLVTLVVVCGVILGFARLNIAVAVALTLAGFALKVCQLRGLRAHVSGLIVGGFVGYLIAVCMPISKATPIPGIIVILLSGITGSSVGALIDYRKSV